MEDKIMTSPELLIKKKNVIFDATLLSTLQSCARLADFRFNHYFESLKGKSNAIECGSLVHKILEVFNQSIVNGLKRDQAIGQGMMAGQLYITGCADCSGWTEKCTECGGTGSADLDDEHYADGPVACQYCDGKGKFEKPTCNHQPNEYPGLKNTSPDNEKGPPKKTGYKWVLETMDQYFDHYINDIWVPLNVEWVHGKMLYEDDDIRVYWKAKFDLIVQANIPQPFPVDHKTMSQDRDQTKLHNQFIGQCFVMGTRSMVVNKIGFQISKKPPEKFKRVMHSYTADNLAEWQQEIVPYWAYQLLAFQEAKYYPPRWTNCENKYGRCQFIDVCSADRNMREELLRQQFKIGEKWDPTNE